jgi:hypothetical protein
MKKYLFIITLVALGQTSLQADSAVIGFLFGNNLKTKRQEIKKCIEVKVPEYKNLSTEQAAAELAYTDCARETTVRPKRSIFSMTSYIDQLLNDIENCAKEKYEYYKTLPQKYLQDVLALRACTK